MLNACDRRQANSDLHAAERWGCNSSAQSGRPFLHKDKIKPHTYTHPGTCLRAAILNATSATRAMTADFPVPAPPRISNSFLLSAPPEQKY